MRFQIIPYEINEEALDAADVALKELRHYHNLPKTTCFINVSDYNGELVLHQLVNEARQSLKNKNDETND